MALPTLNGLSAERAAQLREIWARQARAIKEEILP